MKKLFFRGTTIIALLLFSSSVFSQIEKQNIRGIVLDNDTNTELVGATVRLLNVFPEIGATTDDKGQYQLNGVAVGYQQIAVNYLGYAKQTISEVLVESGKETVLEIRMQTSNTELDEVIVRGSVNRSRSSAVTSLKTITVEETLRFPATFYDPARLASTFAGVVNDNDQANNMSIRGNSPNGMSWRVEGVEIVNPNHLSNAGTINDRPTRNGGGVNILSAQLLGTSDFMTGAFPAQYGNALSGVMDMHLRKGNNQNHEFTGQIGLIGLDLAAEGPLSKKGGASYLINYRYSTLGILSAMGVDLGDEAISFQDIAFNLSFPTEKAGQFTIFGMGGISDNIFEGPRDTALIEFEKDRFDISVKSSMGAMGVTHAIPVGANSVWRTVAVYSKKDVVRTSNFIESDFISTSLQAEDDFVESRMALSSIFSSRINPLLRFKAGLFATQHTYDYNSIFISNFSTNLIDGEDQGWLIEPFVDFETKLGKNVTLNAGLHYVYFTLNETQSIEPRTSLTYHLNGNQSLSLAYGLHSNTQLPQLYFERNSANGELFNFNLELNKAHHIVLSYTNRLNSTTTFTGEVYYQSLFDLPVLASSSSSYSAINDIDGFRTERQTLSSEGTGTNKGIELSLQKFLSDNYYFLVNTSLYDSKYKGGDGVERNTRFNGNYILNLTGGKEFVKIKKKKTRTFGMNARLAFVGGYRDTPIDLIASAFQGFTFYSNDAYSLKQKDYFKIDARIYFKKNKPKFTSTVALDLQNLTNNQNVAFTYYDTEKGEAIEKFQLGLIPNLTYRIEF